MLTLQGYVSHFFAGMLTGYGCFYDLEIEYWPIFDPTGSEDNRDKKLMAYRKARDQIIDNLTAKFGAPNH